MASKKLMKDKKQGMLTGVCAGIGEYLGINPNIIRGIFIIATIGGAGFLSVGAYVVLSFGLRDVSPDEPRREERLEDGHRNYQILDDEDDKRG